MKKVFFIMLLIMLALIGCSTKEQSKKKVEITVSAAASLQDALENIKTKFETKNPNIKINFNFGASGALQQQISQGAPVDLFFSAAEDKFDKLVQDGLIEKENSLDLVGNELVLVTPTASDKGIQSFADLGKAGKISIGTPEAVPAGQYAKETLDKIKIWPTVSEKMVFAKDVRQVLTYVETENVDAGIVYKTDALSSKKVKIVATADENSHDPIIYPAGVVKNSSHPTEAKKFYEYMQTQASIFEKYGFRSLQ